MAKTETTVVVDRAGEEHDYCEDGDYSYWFTYTDADELIVTRNESSCDPAPTVEVERFYQPRYMRKFWQ